GIIFILLPLVLFSQNQSDLPVMGNSYTLLYGNTDHLVDRIDIRYKNTYQYLHTDAKPYLRSHVAALVSQYAGTGPFSKTDSFNLNFLQTDNDEFFPAHTDRYYHGDVFNFFYSASPDVFYKFFTIRINPVLHTEAGFTSDTGAVRFLNTRGIELRGSIDDKVG